MYSQSTDGEYANKGLFLASRKIERPYQGYRKDDDGGVGQDVDCSIGKPKGCSS
jgi:hypothetical protein